MKLLLATNKLLGDDGFCHAIPGEIVLIGTECSSPENRDQCGCNRDFSGANGSTTSAIVAEVSLSHDEFVAFLRQRILSYTSISKLQTIQSEIGSIGDGDNPQISAILEELSQVTVSTRLLQDYLIQVQAMITEVIVSHFPVGAIIGRDNNLYYTKN